MQEEPDPSVCSLEPLILAAELATAAMGKARGCLWVAQLARQHGLTCEDDQPISSRLIQDWITQLHRDEAPPEARQRYERLRCETIPGGPVTYADLLVQAKNDKHLVPYCLALARSLVKVCEHVATQGLTSPV
jgi:hypothetical protein